MKKAYQNQQNDVILTSIRPFYPPKIRVFKIGEDS